MFSFLHKYPILFFLQRNLESFLLVRAFFRDIISCVCFLKQAINWKCNVFTWKQMGDRFVTSLSSGCSRLSFLPSRENSFLPGNSNSRSVSLLGSPETGSSGGDVSWLLAATKFIPSRNGNSYFYLGIAFTGKTTTYAHLQLRQFFPEAFGEHVFLHSIFSPDKFNE